MVIRVGKEESMQDNEIFIQRQVQVLNFEKAIQGWDKIMDLEMSNCQAGNRNFNGHVGQ